MTKIAPMKSENPRLGLLKQRSFDFNQFWIDQFCAGQKLLPVSLFTLKTCEVNFHNSVPSERNLSCVTRKVRHLFFVKNQRT